MSIIRLQCLQECFISFNKLSTEWKDRRYPEQAIQRFIVLNRDVFAFLGIIASIDEVNYEKGLRLTASKFVGAAPLRTPTTGKYYTDIQVLPRFGENISELAYLLRDILEPDYIDKELFHSDYLRAPFYFDCINYFNSFLKAIPEPWNKFDTIIKIESHPCSSTNWSKYAQASINPDNVLQFENRKNILSKNHKEWQELTYMLGVAISEFDSIKTPLSIKQRYFSELSILKKYLNEHQKLSPIAKFQIHSFEPSKIKDLKEKANKLLEHNISNNKSWKIDSAELFERYVQYILTQVGKVIGAQVLSNIKFSIKRDHSPAWMLRYLEPDVVIHKNETFYFADAKYKAHMLNVSSHSDVFKETFRSDLHQVLAYSSFDSSKDKMAMLFYPSDKFKDIKLEIVNRIGNVRNDVHLIGLPFTSIGLDVFINKLSEVFRK